MAEDMLMIDGPVIGREYLVIGDVRLECQWWGLEQSGKPTLVLLHEGLGCVALWRDFPKRLAEISGCPVFAYSRRGYGQSDPAVLPRPIDYMRREALYTLPNVLDEIGLEKGILIGHSDGASIAAIHAGEVADRRISGIVLIAPHFFTEPEGLDSIADAKVAFENGNLRNKLSKYHDDVDNAFHGWNDAWLNPDFQHWNIEYAVDGIAVPVLAVQGRNDAYGTLAQIETIDRLPSTQVTKVVIDDCGHSPHVEKPEALLQAISDFLFKHEGFRQ